MAKTSVFLPALIFISLLSCNKSTDIPPEAPSNSDFMALNVGNYWIYQNYILDTNGVGAPTDDWDSAFISKDTLVDGKTYYKMHRKTVLIMPYQLVEFCAIRQDTWLTLTATSLCRKIILPIP
ncbi:MAG: hypothetical protein MZU84_02080 [Sphingobacterium sp.]|nr:hypothetical protein [Sphingobacterium sp.]